MITRPQALIILQKYLRTKNLVKHAYAVEAIMMAMAEKLGEDPDLWGIVGLLHDLDFDFTKEEPEKHSLMTVNLVGELLPEEAVNAIKAHNFQYTAQIPMTYLDKGLIASDAVSGLIIAAALVMPSKKLSEVTVPTLVGKFKDKSFAAGCNRKRIELCQDTELSLEEFLGLSLKACQGISQSLEL
jgi:uncharacterized protein